jgi:hypothetical protein
MLGHDRLIASFSSKSSIFCSPDQLERPCHQHGIAGFVNARVRRGLCRRDGDDRLQSRCPARARCHNCWLSSRNPLILLIVWPSPPGSSAATGRQAGTTGHLLRRGVVRESPKARRGVAPNAHGSPMPAPAASGGQGRTWPYLPSAALKLFDRVAHRLLERVPTLGFLGIGLPQCGERRLIAHVCQCDRERGTEPSPRGFIGQRLD